MLPHRLHHGDLDDDDDDHLPVFSTGYCASSSSSWSHPCDSCPHESLLSKHKIPHSPPFSSRSNEMRGSATSSSLSITSSSNSFASSSSSSSSHDWTARRDLAQAWGVSGSASTASQGHHMREKYLELQDRYASEGFDRQAFSSMEKGSTSRASSTRNASRGFSSSPLSKSDSCLFTTPSMALSSGVGLSTTDVRHMPSSSFTELHGGMSSLGTSSLTNAESSTKNSFQRSAQSGMSLAERGYSLSSMNNSLFSELQDESLAITSLQKLSVGNSLTSELLSMTASSSDMNNPFTSRPSAMEGMMNPSMQKIKTPTTKSPVWLRSGSSAKLWCAIIMLLLLLLLLPLVLPPLPPPPLWLLFLPIVILLVLVCQALLSPRLNLVETNER